MLSDWSPAPTKIWFLPMFSRGSALVFTCVMVSMRSAVRMMPEVAPGADIWIRSSIS